MIMSSINKTAQRKRLLLLSFMEDIRRSTGDTSVVDKYRQIICESVENVKRKAKCREVTAIVKTNLIC
jgi:hypothetical protein